MRIQTNTSALKAKNNFTKINGELGKALEKLSSGYCINRAADNAAGLAVSEKMRYMITGLEQGELNIQDGASYVQVAEGALFEIEDMLNRSKELTEQAMNGVYTENERKAINDEIDQIKSEIDRILTSASFNGLSIWGNDNCSKKVVGTVEKTAVRMLNSKISTKVTNKNKRYFPDRQNSAFKINANEDGYMISWKACDGNSYATKRVAWPSPLAGSHNLMIGSNCDPKLEDFDLNIPFEVAEGSEVKHLVQAFNNCQYGTDINALVNGNATVANGKYVGCQGILDYGYIVNSNVDVESINDKFIEPDLDVNGTNVICPTNLNDTWKVKLKIGTFDENGVVSYENVVAESSMISYQCINKNDPTWYKNNNYSTYFVKGGSGKTLGDALSILDSSQTTPSLSGLDDGVIHVYIDIPKAGRVKLTYETNKNDDIASLTDMITNTHLVSKVDIPNSTNLNFTTYYGCSDVKFDAPIYEANYDVVVQGGLEENEQIHITYDQLSLEVMGMDTASVLSQEEAAQTFDVITEALNIVTKQHGEFGSYTNRLEHASNSNLNRFENLQASESRIRDTDMAKTFSTYTAKNVLMQAAQSLLAQANTRPEMVLQMLG